MEAELTKLTGTVEEVVFHNEESGFAVLEVDVEGELTEIVGEVSEIAAGEAITASGRFREHPSYGLQFKAEWIEHTLPSTAGSILRYLSKGSIKGIGPVLAGRIVSRFGRDSLTVIEKTPERLSEIPGISERKAREIGEQSARQFGLRRVMAFLEGYRISSAMALKAYKLMGDLAPDLIRDNPYLLCSPLIGLPFPRADEMADDFEISAEDPHRLAAGMAYILRHNAGEGHTCLPEEKLLSLAKEFLQVEEAPLLETLEREITDERLLRYQGGGRSFLYLAPFYHAEATIASRVALARELVPESFLPLTAEIDLVEEEQGITYDPEQRRAMAEAVQSNMFILTGGPGTGKTTTLCGILALLRNRGEKVVLAAPTGRAAKRMEEVTGQEAKTLHRLLKVTGEGGEAVFRANEKNPVEAAAVIVDEFSMVDTLLMENLLRGVSMQTRLIMVGDSDQLPSVGAGNVLGDLLKSGVLPSVHLEKVFRQAAQSLIVTGAHAIVEGKMPELSRKDGDLFFLTRTEPEAELRLVTELVSRRLPASYGYDPLLDIQVITPSRQGAVGTRELNRRLQAALNPPSPGKREHKDGERVFREGDKVMQIRNNYDLEWITEDGTDGSGIFNGDMGVLETIDRENRRMKILFEDKLVSYPFQNCDQLEHAYAITVHKSQGSEFEAVVMPLAAHRSRLHYRNLLYTAVTRARRLLVMTGVRETVETMVQNNRQTLRYTNLAEMLREVSEGFYE